MTILLTLCDRPLYTKQVLRSLSTQLNGERLIIWIDGDNKDVIDLAKEFCYSNKEVNIRGVKIGCNHAMVNSINYCFENGAEDLVNIEDDCVPAPDFISWAKWAFTQLDEDVVSFSGYSNIKEDHVAYNRVSQDLSGTCFLDGWICYGWGLTKHLWESSFKHLKVESLKEGESWDTGFYHILQARGKRTLKPWLSRILNIGSEGGSFCPSPEWHAKNVMLSKWAGMPHETRPFTGLIPHTHHTQEGEDWFSYKELYGEMVARFDKGFFVEMGSWKGRSGSFMATEIANSGKNIKFDCVDHWQGGDGNHEPRCYDIFMRNMRHLEGFFNPVKMASVEAASTYPNGSLDFVFIDGRHDYSSIMEDLNAWVPKVKSGGVIAGHDMIWGHDNAVARAVLERWDKVIHTRSNCWIKEL